MAAITKSVWSTLLLFVVLFCDLFQDPNLFPLLLLTETSMTHFLCIKFTYYLEV